MNEIENGGPAFPHVLRNEYDSATRGMTLRDYFAAKVLQALLSDGSTDEMCESTTEEGIEEERIEYADRCAKDAYRYADAMIRARGE